jgi:hypothetical protein
MAAAQLRELPVRRRMTAREASAMVGSGAPERPPTFTDAVLCRDFQTGAPQLIYAPLPSGAAELRRAVLGIDRWTAVQRASGMFGDSRTFGAYPRRPIYGREGCTPTQLSTENPALHGVLLRYANELSEALARWVPEVFAAGLKEVTPVKAEWRLGETTWTSGVINNTTVLPYHRDAGNFRAWSAMPVLRRGVTGGQLHLPEYDVTVPCRDGWAVLFPGYELVHGVTPMRLRKRDGYRFSVVFYALRGMRDCATVAMETTRARARRTEREQTIAARLVTGDPAPINDYRTAGAVVQAHGRDPRVAKKASGRLIGGKDAKTFRPDPPRVGGG